jgi:hypothetical protein
VRQLIELVAAESQARVALDVRQSHHVRDLDDSTPGRRFPAVGGRDCQQAPPLCRGATQ